MRQGLKDRIQFNPSNPPWNGTINFFVERFIADPSGVIAVSFPVFNDADGCWKQCDKLKCLLLPTL